MHQYTAQIRFIVEPVGTYRVLNLRLHADSIVEASARFTAFVQGYMVATGLSALLESVSLDSDHDSVWLHDTPKVRQLLGVD